MNGANIISIAITLFAIAAGSLFNNLRISDSATHTGQRFDDVNKRFDGLIRLMDARFNATERKLDEILRIMGDRETRLRSTEQRIT